MRSIFLIFFSVFFLCSCVANKKGSELTDPNHEFYGQNQELQSFFVNVDSYVADVKANPDWMEPSNIGAKTGAEQLIQQMSKLKVWPTPKDYKQSKEEIKKLIELSKSPNLYVVSVLDSWVLLDARIVPVSFGYWQDTGKIGKLQYRRMFLNYIQDSKAQEARRIALAVYIKNISPEYNSNLTGRKYAWEMINNFEGLHKSYFEILENGISKETNDEVKTLARKVVDKMEVLDNDE